MVDDCAGTIRSVAHRERCHNAIQARFVDATIAIVPLDAKPFANHSGPDVGAVRRRAIVWCVTRPRPRDYREVRSPLTAESGPAVHG